MIEGTWIPVVAEMAGQPFPDAILKTMKLAMREGTYTVHVGEKVDRGTIKLDPAANPAAIDITGTEGPNQGTTFLAIYELSGDSLRICYDLAGAARPTAFATAPDTKQFLVTFRRESR